MFLALSQATTFVAFFLVRFEENRSGGSALLLSEDERIRIVFSWETILTLEVLCITSFGLFLKSINEGYIATFLTTIRAKQFACLRYHDAKTDEAKADIFFHHESYYISIREEISIWLAENWSKLNEEKPSWFNSRRFASIPDAMIPKDELQLEEALSDANSLL